ncbi:MAG TPA: YkgJ family cysteine cluster protein [Cellvibrionaceae bacterium]
MDQLIKKCISATKKKLGINPSPKNLVHAISSLEENTDLITRQQIATECINFACKKGCAHCCNLRVEVLPPEAFYIASYIKALPDSQRQVHLKKLATHTVYSKGRTFVNYNKPCPFLSENNTCSIYSVRPHKCRSNLSKSEESCKLNRDPEENYALKVAHNQLALETINLYKNKNCIMHPTELGLGVLAALNDENLEANWHKGEQVFALLPENIRL